MRPVRNVVYTAAEVYALELDDSPSLGFRWRDRQACVQTSHVTDVQLLSVPGFADTRWRYLRTTHEWIPVFECVYTELLLPCLDISLEFDSLFKRYEVWATPKGFPREWYTYDPDKGVETIEVYSDVTVTTPGELGDA